MWNEYEDRIIWDDLAPSLQAIIRSTQTSIEKLNKLIPIVDNLVKLGDTTITNNLLKLGNSTVTNNLINFSNNSSTINNLINKSGDILNITNIFGGSGSGSGGVMDSWSGDPGKIAKTNSKGALICDDLVYTIRAAGNATDVSTLKGIPLSMKDIFYSWDRISHEPTIGASKSSQNLLTNEQIEARAAYDFLEAKNLIRCTRNSNTWTCFLSNSLYDPSYKITYAIDTEVVPSGDDDILVFVLGYMVDKNGCFHTLQVQRWGDIDDAQHNNRFAITYDVYTAFFNSNPINVLARADESELTASNFNKKYCYLEVEKTPTKIVAKTSQIVNWSSITFDSKRNPTNPPPFVKTLTFELPSTKPSNWPQDMYDNIKQMMQNNSKIGFGTESNECCFAVYQDKCVNIMDKIEVYDLASGKIRIYDKNGNEIKSSPIGDAIQPNSLVYSSYIKRLFYYRKDNNFVEMFTGGN